MQPPAALSGKKITVTEPARATRLYASIFLILSCTSPHGVSAQIGVDTSLTSVPCTCECCQTAELLPSQVGIANNGTATHQCVSGNAADGCGTLCTVSNADQILSSAAGEVDYSRYCLYKCKPSMASAGSFCTSLDVNEASKNTHSDGNGKLANSLGITAASGALSGSASQVPVIGSLANWDPAMNQQMQAAMLLRAEQTAQQSQSVSRHIAWDMRKLVTQRLRSEAGASVAHAAAGMERIRTNQDAVQQNQQLIQKMTQILPTMDSQMDQDVAGSGGNATLAQDSASSTRIADKEAAAAEKTVVIETNKLTLDMVKKKTEKAAEAEAKTFGKLVYWDKPENYDKVVANRAAEPYLQQMVTAIQRVSEYEAYSAGLLSQSRAALRQARAISSQANAMEAQGDKMSATVARHRIQKLLASSRQLEVDGAKYQQLAFDTQKKVAEWQDAGSKAAAFASWQFQQMRTTPAP